MTPSSTVAPRRRLPSWLVPTVGYAVSIACLAWVYLGFDWRRELPRLLATDWRWVLLAVVFDWVVYICQGLRWTALLSPLGQFSVWKSTQAIYIGLFANEVLPLRSGEIIRCYLQRRWTGLPLSVVISSVLIERLWDGVWLVAAFALVSKQVELPGFLTVMSRGLLVLLAILGGLMAATLYYKERAKDAASRSRWSRMLRPLVDGVHSMGTSRSFWWAGFLSFCYLALQIVPLYALLRGYGMNLSISAALVLLVILRLGTVIPQAPGNVGSFQALIVAGLGLFGFSRADSTGFATLSFFVVTVPLWFGGFVALMLTRMRLGDIHREAHESLDEAD
jgi:glycosyltransferase 2 family protein